MSERVIPVVAEDVRVATRSVERERVRVRRRVVDEERTFDLEHRDEEIDVQRVPVDRWVDAAPPVREEGDAIVIPCLEEVLVVEKRLRVREEIWIRRTHARRSETRTAHVRHHEVDVQREAEPTHPSPGEDP